MTFEDTQGRTARYIAGTDQNYQPDNSLLYMPQFLESRPSASASGSTSSVATPVNAPVTSYSDNMGQLAMSSSSEMVWPMRQEYHEQSPLSIRPPLHPHASFSSDRYVGSGSLPYFSSLPTTPTELAARDQSLSPYLNTLADGRHSHSSQRETSGWLSDGRKSKNRVEQNREKMRAYHRRVMQQRDALSSITTELTFQLNPVSSSSGAPRSRSQITPGSQEASPTNTDGVSDSGQPRRSTIDTTSSNSLRNRQKQESKARLRKREIDQVYELAQYAALVNRGLYPTDASSSATAGSLRYGMPTEAYSQQPSGAVLAEVDEATVQTVIRVFRAHRSNWGALVAAEQRLASEAFKVSTPGEAFSVSDDKTSDGILPTTGWRCIELLVASLQSEERKYIKTESGRALSLPGAELPGAHNEGSSTRLYSGVSAYPGNVELGQGGITSRHGSGSYAPEDMGQVVMQTTNMPFFSPDIASPGTLSATSSRHADYFTMEPRAQPARSSIRARPSDFYADDQPRYPQINPGENVGYGAEPSAAGSQTYSQQNIPYVAVTAPDMYAQNQQHDHRHSQVNPLSNFVELTHAGQPSRSQQALKYEQQMQPQQQQHHHHQSISSEQHQYTGQIYRGQQHPGQDPNRQPRHH